MIGRFLRSLYVGKMTEYLSSVKDIIAGLVDGSNNLLCKVT